MLFTPCRCNVVYFAIVLTQGLLEEMEGWWLGCWRGVLLGTPSSYADRVELSKASADIAREFGCSSKHDTKILRQQIEVGPC